jgi:RNA polymerase sigma-70 factor (ECF subfamily)
MDPQQRQLLERCRAGDALAVEALINAHQDRVYRLALSILEDPAEADEAAQETFLAVLRSLDSFRGEAAFTTWLYAIVVNVCRMRRRRGRTWQRLQQTLAAALRLSDPPPAPEAAVIQGEAQAALWRAVQKLGEKQRVPIILRYYHGCSVAEIAQVLELNEGTVHSRLSIARDRLRAALTRPAAPAWVTDREA